MEGECLLHKNTASYGRHENVMPTQLNLENSGKITQIHRSGLNRNAGFPYMAHEITVFKANMASWQFPLYVPISAVGGIPELGDYYR